MSIDRKAVDVRACWFLTLTYPGAYPKSPRHWKADLHNFHRRLMRKWGALAGVWSLEFQVRTDGRVPHFHVLLIGPDRDYGLLLAFREWAASAWADVVGSRDARHGTAGTSVERVRSWERVAGYMSKQAQDAAPYVDEETGEVQSIGRTWAVWGELPVTPVTEQVSEQAAFGVRRIVARVLGWHVQSRRSGLSCFLPPDVGRRVMQWASGRPPLADASANPDVAWRPLHRAGPTTR